MTAAVKSFFEKETEYQESYWLHGRYNWLRQTYANRYLHPSDVGTEISDQHDIYSFYIYALYIALKNFMKYILDEIFQCQ